MEIQSEIIIPQLIILMRNKNLYGQEITKENLDMFYLQLMYFSARDMFLLGPFLVRELMLEGFSGGS